MRRICIITPSKDAYSGTFIRSHIDRLPGEVHVLYGGFMPKYAGDGEPLLKPSLLKGGIHALLLRAPGRPPRFHTPEGALAAYLRRHRIEAVVAEYGPVGVQVMEVCGELGIPLIVHFHGYDAYAFGLPNLKERGLPGRYRELFGRAAAIVAVSHAMERQLISLGAPTGKVHYCPCGANVDLFDGAQPGQVPPLFVAVGRFVEKKAPHLTLLAFSEVARLEPDARLVTVGDGPLLGPCEQMAQALGIADRVEFRGPQAHDEVALLMRGARAFVQHSVRALNGDSEGTPVAVLEAQATGLPVVATRHAGIKDVVVEGQTGLLVDECDTRGMAAHMLRLAREPELAGRLGAAARERVRERFGMDRSIERLWSVIEGAIHSGRGK